MSQCGRESVAQKPVQKNNLSPGHPVNKIAYSVCDEQRDTCDVAGCGHTGTGVAAGPAKDDGRAADKRSKGGPGGRDAYDEGCVRIPRVNETYQGD